MCVSLIFAPNLSQGKQNLTITRHSTTSSYALSASTTAKTEKQNCCGLDRVRVKRMTKAPHPETCAALLWNRELCRKLQFSGCVGETDKHSALRAKTVYPEDNRK